MRRVINSTYMSVDGVVQEPQRWTFGYRSEDLARYARDLVFSVDTLIMGRRTYEVFAETWPKITDDTGVADRINALPKFVGSDTLTDPAWNNTTVSGVKDFPDLVRDLKTQPGRDTDATNLISHHATEATFRLADVGRFDSDVIILHYQPA